MKKKSFVQAIKDDWKDTSVLLHNIPSMTVCLFVIAVVCMNLLANKSVNTGAWTWLALDCGMLVSWVSFLSMDIITKRFGPKAATKVSVIAVLINLVMCGIFYLASIIPGVWSASFIEGNEIIINSAINDTFGGTWYVLFGSTVAFLVSSIVNNGLNHLIGKALNKATFTAYMCRTYVSTAVGQFLDNLVFALIVSHIFFSWTTIQCITCSCLGAIVELVCEVIFSPLGYKISKDWEKNGIGDGYFKHLKKNEVNV